MVGWTRDPAIADDGGAGALLVATDPFFDSRPNRFGPVAARQRIPAICPQREYVPAGGLIGDGPGFSDGCRQAEAYVGRVCGREAADLPVMQPPKFELVLDRRSTRHSRRRCSRSPTR
jgi:hypothetical protein